MNIIKCCVEVTAINLNTDMLSVFDRFRELRDIPFLPVVDGHQKPVGVIRETDLKEYAYGRFGHDLVRRMPFRHFIRETRIVSSTATRDDLLTSAATNPNPDGLVIVENGLPPIIICTGYSEVVSPESLRQIGVRGLIHKPTDFHELVVLIRALLSKQGGPLVPSPAEPALSGLRVAGLIEPKLP